MTTYGMTPRDIPRIAAITSILGVLLLAIEVGVGHAHGTLLPHLGIVLTIPAAIAFGPPLLIGACGVTNIALAEDDILLRVGHHVIDRKRLADLTCISLRARVAAVVLQFRDGSRMRLFAIPVPRRQALCDALLASAPVPSDITVRS